MNVKGVLRLQPALTSIRACAIVAVLLLICATASAQSDNLSDEQYCRANIESVGSANMLKLGMIGDACFHAAEARIKRGRPGDTKAKQENLMFAAAFYLGAAKARIRLGSLRTAGQELDFADEALNMVLAHPASQDLRRGASTVRDYVHGLKDSIVNDKEQ